MKEKTKRRLVVQYFLRKLQQTMESNQGGTIDSVWLNIYTRDDLMNIAKWVFLPTLPERIRLERMDTHELLETIGDDFYILNYEIEQAREELSETSKITIHKVSDTLEQLGMETHYLMEKPIFQWDDYDYANFRALYRKAGNPAPLFGIFESSVKEDDKYIVITPPDRLYTSEQRANTALSKLVLDGKLAKGDAKIMML